MDNKGTGRGLNTGFYLNGLPTLCYKIKANMGPVVELSKMCGKPDLLKGEMVEPLISKNQVTLVDEKKMTKNWKQKPASCKIPLEVEFAKKCKERKER